MRVLVDNLTESDLICEVYEIEKGVHIRIHATEKTARNPEIKLVKSGDIVVEIL